MGSLMGSMGRQEASGGDAGALRMSHDGHSLRQLFTELATYTGVSLRITTYRNTGLARMTSTCSKYMHLRPPDRTIYAI